jgi:hypothetical protein
MNTREKYAEMLESEEHERRMKVIAQNGNSGEHYEQDMLNGFNKPTEDELDPSYSCTDSRIVADKILKADERKATPVFSGVLKYFPNALKEVAKCSKAGNDQHHPDKPLHWDMDKSKDEYDALTRHLIDHTINPIDDDGVLHLAKVAWRALAGLERHLTNKE